MEKKKAKSLSLHKETLRHLAPETLKRALGGGGRIRVPLGFDENTEEIWVYVDDTEGC